MAKAPVVQNDILEGMGEEAPVAGDPNKDQPLYRIFAESRIPVSRAVGPGLKRKYDAALTAFTVAREAHNLAYEYYNSHQEKDRVTPKGAFKRGDATENLVYSNVNTMVPATYSKNPQFTCTTGDTGDKEFCKTMQAFINAIIKKKHAPGINLKPRAKRATMLAELTNLGVMKLEHTLKDQSREQALNEMEALRDRLAKAKKEEVGELYGQLMALEQQTEVREPRGYKLSCVLSHRFIPDPFCECDDLSDANWVIEEAFLPTEYLNARFTEKKGEERRLVYKPSHKAKWSGPVGEDDDASGLVMEALTGETTQITEYTDEERLGYLYTYMTEVCFVWDKVTRLVFLFAKDDWSWPIWVWDDPFKLSRFFPYFVIQFTMSTSGIVAPGVVSYYLDQQDEVNDINRQVALLRRRVFDFVFYNSNQVDKDEAEKFAKALRGDIQGEKFTLGVKLDPQMKFGDVFGTVGLPDKEAQPFFDKSQAYAAIDRLSATSDAIKGIQFKSNTTEDAVQAYVDATRMRIGAKVDAIEDCLADMGLAIAEIGIQNYTKEDVEGLIGKALAAGWKQMSVEEFNATYSIEITAGSIEKPTSVFKKKEAIEVVQAIGQFAKSAPMSTLEVILQVLEQAFTEVVITPEQWEAIRAEVRANLGGGQGGQQQQGGMTPEQLAKLPPEVKQAVVQMKQQGASDEEILAFLQERMGQQQQLKGQSNGTEASE